METESPRGRRDRVWRELGEANEAERTDRYVRDYLPAALDVMRAEGAETDVLVLTAGTQPYSMAMSLCFRRARQRVVFLHTEASLPHAREAVRLAGVDPALVRERPVDKADSAAVYRHVRELHRELGAGAGITVDFTSGSKAMTGGASAVAGLLALPQIYIESTARLQAPNGLLFGLEEAHEVDHPLVVFGDARREEAERAWADGRFEQARATFADLGRAAVPGYHWRARELLASAYAAWDRLELGKAIRPLDDAAMLLGATVAANMPGDLRLVRDASRVRRQAEAARTLQSAMVGRPWNDALQASTLLRYLLGRATRATPDLSALLAYRAIELAVQRRLGAHGIDPGQPVYPEPDALLERYNRRVEEPHRLAALPGKLGLVQGWHLLRALPDPVVAALPKDAIDHVGKRNESIYAHGFRRLDEKAAGGFLAVAVSVARAVAEADGQAFPWPDTDFVPVELT